MKDLQRPLKFEIASTRNVETAQCLRLLENFLNNEVGAQSAAPGVIQQLSGLSSSLAKSTKPQNKQSGQSDDSDDSGNDEN
ncbi:hypothetical protein H4219_000861 [Mycoemilia scoparia]|uniref:Uncharacterized protein n=1 Tax=Mycoemilia scoparia TaxID=417184 RepID=A0A9W8AB79_9FUNG|nr:hypothetical protein H4219_000861 [Mycoemilia scoparia]